MLRLDPERRTYSAEFKHRTFGRIHLRLKTKAHAIAMHRHSALEQLLDTGEPVRDLVDALRAQKLTIEAVYECVRARLPFETLRASTWPTLGEAHDQYITYLEGREQGSEATAKIAAQALRHAVAFFGDEQRLESLPPDQVLAFRRHLSATTEEGGAGLHSNTVGLYVTKLGAVYTFLQKREAKRAVQQKRAPATLYNPVDRDEHVPEPVQTRVRFLSEHEAERILTATPDRFQAIVALGLFAGLRIGEVLNLRPPPFDVDPELGVLFIQAREGWKPKNGVNREIPISSALEPFIERHLAEFTGETYLLTGRNGYSTYDKRHLERRFDRMVTDAGLVCGIADPMGITFHTLRHTFASWLVMEGVDLLTVARLMGHTTIKQVQQTYGHLSPEHRRAAIELLARRWSERAQVSEEVVEEATAS